MKLTLCIVAAMFGASPTTVGADVLMVLTSHDVLGDDDGNQTGWYLPEAAHPYDVFEKAGMKMVWASPKGGKAPVDKGSVAAYKKDDSSVQFMDNKVWKHTEKLADIDPKDFDAVFVVGGYGVMWDLVGNKDLEGIVAAIWKSGGIVSGVCHGPAALVGVSLGDGKSLVKGKEVACFSNAEEDVMQRKKLLSKTCQDAFEDAGAKYTETKPWGDHVAVAGRLVTGQNPSSAKGTAEAVVKALKGEDDEHDHHEHDEDDHDEDDHEEDDHEEDDHEEDDHEEDDNNEEEKIDMNMPTLYSRVANSSRFAVAVGICGGFAAVAAVGFRIIAGRRQVHQGLSEAITNGDDVELAE